MSYREAIPVTAGQDLTATQWKALTISGTIAATNTTAAGVQEGKPESGEDATVVYFGRTKIAAGGAIAARGGFKATTSGWFVAVGSNELAVGHALEAITSGSVGRAVVNFVGAFSSVVSGHLT